MPTSNSCGITLKKRVYFYIPSEGEGSVPRKRQGRSFKEVKGIRKLHSVRTTPAQCRIFTRHHSCMCEECLLGNGDSCANTEYVDKWCEMEMNRDGQVAVTRQNEDSAGGERVNALTDLVEADSVVAIAAADDGCYDYYLLKVSSDGPFILQSDTTDDHGATYQQGSFVLEGHLFL